MLCPRFGVFLVAIREILLVNVLWWSLNFLCFFKGEQKGNSLFIFSGVLKPREISVTFSFFSFNEAVSFFDCVYTMFWPFLVMHKNMRVISRT